ncbi:unnamed protein product [Umbelopsis sp. WA50703]|jgi:hypothetical protein
MIERIYSNVAIFHESDRIITTYKFEDSPPSPLVKSHVAKRLVHRKQWKKNAAFANLDCQEKVKSPSSGLGGLPSPPVESPKEDDSAVSPIALDTPSGGSEELQSEEAAEEEVDMSDAEIMEKIAQLKAEKHRLFQQVKDMLSKDAATPQASPQCVVEEKPALSLPTIPQYSTTSRPSSPPTSPNPRMSPYPSPSSPVNGNGSYNNKNAFKFNDRPFSRTPYVCG